MYMLREKKLRTMSTNKRPVEIMKSDPILLADSVFHSQLNLDSIVEKNKNLQIRLNTGLDELNKCQLELDLLHNSLYVKVAIKIRSILHRMVPSKKDQFERYVRTEREKIQKASVAISAYNDDLPLVNNEISQISGVLDKVGVLLGGSVHPNSGSGISEKMSITFVTANLQEYGGNKVKVEMIRGLAEKGHKIRLVISIEAWSQRKYHNLPVNVYHNLNDCPVSDFIIASHFGSVEKIIPFGGTKGRPIHFVQGDEPNTLKGGGAYNRALEAFMSQVFKHIIISEYMFDFKEKYNQKIIGRVQNGVNSEIFRPNYNSDPKTICFINRVGKAKGCQIIINALGLIAKRHQDIRIICFGFGKDLSEFNFHLGKGPFSPTPPIEYISQPSESLRADIYREAGIYISASFQEGSPLSVLEAMSSGAVAVTTPTGIDYAESEKNIMFVDYDNPYSICKAVTKLIEDQALYLKIKNNGIAIAHERTWKKEVIQFEDILIKELQNEVSQRGKLVTKKLGDNKYIATNNTKKALLLCNDWNICTRMLPVEKCLMKKGYDAELIAYDKGAEKVLKDNGLKYRTLDHLIDGSIKSEVLNWFNSLKEKEILYKEKLMFRGFDLIDICRFEYKANKIIQPNQPGFSDLRATVIHAAELILAYNEYLSKIDINHVYIWNGDRYFIRALLACLIQQNIRFTFLERGHFPDTLIVDSIGVGFQNEMRCKLWPNRELLLPFIDFGELKKFISLYHSNQISLEKQENYSVADLVATELRGNVSNVLVPLQVPIDTNMLFRSRDIVGNEELISCIIDAIKDLGAEHNIFIRKHPGDIWTDYNALKKSIKRHKNIKFVDKYNIHDLLKISSAVVTLNSQVGIEALAYKKPVIVCANATYDQLGFTYDVLTKNDLVTQLAYALGNVKETPLIDEYLGLLVQKYLKSSTSPDLNIG